MMCISKWLGAALAIALLAMTAATAPAQEIKYKLTDLLITSGRVKSVDAAKRTFFLEGNRQMFKLSDKVVIISSPQLSGGGDKVVITSSPQLSGGDEVSISDQGTVGGLISYIMVKQGSTKDSTMRSGTIKSIDKRAETISLNFTKIEFPYAQARVLVNMKNSRAEELRMGEHAIVIVSGTRKLTHVLVERR